MTLGPIMVHLATACNGNC